MNDEQKRRQASANWGKRGNSVKKAKRQKGQAMNILIIGGTGNISRAVVENLIQRQHQVTLLNRGTTPAPAGTQHIACDRSDTVALKTALHDKSFDCIIDFLCFTLLDAANIHAAVAGNCQQFIFISSATVYAKPHNIPVQESAAKGNPVSEYAQQKLATEQWFLEQHAKGFPLTIVRPSHTFGEQWIPSPISKADFTIARRILDGKPIIVHDNGTSLWALTPADEFARALIGLIGNTNAIGEDYHITTDEVMTWRSVYHSIGEGLGKAPDIIAIPSSFIEKKYPELRAGLSGDKANHAVFDNTKIKQAVPGWHCELTMHAALLRSVEWFLADEQRQSINEDNNQRVDDLITAWLAIS